MSEIIYPSHRVSVKPEWSWSSTGRMKSVIHEPSLNIQHRFIYNCFFFSCLTKNVTQIQQSLNSSIMFWSEMSSILRWWICDGYVDIIWSKVSPFALGVPTSPIGDEVMDRTLWVVV